MTEWLLYGGIAAVLLLIAFWARGIYLLKKSGDARIEQKRAELAKEAGRDPERQKTYAQKKEEEALTKLKNNQFTGWILRGFGIK